MKRPKNTKYKVTRVNTSYQGERIEEKIQRILNNKEPIKDGAPLVYTDRKDGVKPEYDIRTDRFEIAIEKMDVVTDSIRAKRANKADANIGEEAKKGMEKEQNKEITGGEPIQGNNE